MIAVATFSNLEDEIYFSLQGRLPGFQVISNFCINLHRARDIGPLRTFFVRRNSFIGSNKAILLVAHFLAMLARCSGLKWSI